MQLGGRVLHVPLRDQDEFEVAPLDPVHLRPHPVDVPLALRGGGLAGEPAELVNPVDDPVGRLAQPSRVQMVVNQSVTCMISSLARPAWMRPGQRAMHGVRRLPSPPAKYEPSQ